METEKELAAYFQEHKDDPSEWGEALAGPTPARKALGVSITVRFSADEAERLRRYAKQHRLTYSQMLRKAVDRLVSTQLDLQVGGNYSTFYPVAPQAQDCTRVIIEPTFQQSQSRTGLAGHLTRAAG